MNSLGPLLRHPWDSSEPHILYVVFLGWAAAFNMTICCTNYFPHYSLLARWLRPYLRAPSLLEEIAMSFPLAVEKDPRVTLSVCDGSFTFPPGCPSLSAPLTSLSWCLNLLKYLYE